MIIFYNLIGLGRKFRLASTTSLAERRLALGCSCWNWPLLFDKKRDPELILNMKQPWRSFDCLVRKQEVGLVKMHPTVC